MRGLVWMSIGINVAFGAYFGWKSAKVLDRYLDDLFDSIEKKCRMRNLGV